MRLPSLQTLRLTARGRAPLWLWALVLAWVLPAVWGSWHHVAHAPARSGAAQVEHSAAAHHDGHGPGTTECRLLDQAACADGLNAAPLEVQLCLASVPQRANPLGQGIPARKVAGYSARAPPTHPVA